MRKVRMTSEPQRGSIRKLWGGMTRVPNGISRCSFRLSIRSPFTSPHLNLIDIPRVPLLEAQNDGRRARRLMQSCRLHYHIHFSTSLISSATSKSYYLAQQHCIRAKAHRCTTSKRTFAATQRKMVASIPNDVFQYSISPAFHTHTLHSGGPPSAFLTRHGTYGLGYFAPTTSSPTPDICALVESTAWRISGKDGKATKAEQSAQLPHVMVTIFEGVWRTKLLAGSSGVETVKEVMFSGDGERGGRNSYMPFRVTGTFSTVNTASSTNATLQSAKGTIFGVYVPPWAENVSGKTGLHCVFLGSAQGAADNVGGLVKEFEVQEASLEWGVCGRFHLGLPSGNEWEGIKF